MAERFEKITDFEHALRSLEKVPKNRKLQFKDFVSGKPEKSGNYVIKNKYGMIGTDDYTTSDGGMWWNEANDGTTLYSPSSFRELGSY